MEKLNRQEYNNKILSKLKECVEEYPYLRFGQILVNLGILEVTSNENGFSVVKDPFYEEPRITWDRMLKL